MYTAGFTAHLREPFTACVYVEFTARVHSLIHLHVYRPCPGYVYGPCTQAGRVYGLCIRPSTRAVAVCGPCTRPLIRPCTDRVPVRVRAVYMSVYSIRPPETYMYTYECTVNTDISIFIQRTTIKIKQQQLECGPMPNVMAAVPNIGVALYSTPQSLADAQYWSE